MQYWFWILVILVLFDIVLNEPNSNLSLTFLKTSSLIDNVDPGPFFVLLLINNEQLPGTNRVTSPCSKMFPPSACQHGALLLRVNMNILKSAFTSSVSVKKTSGRALGLSSVGLLPPCCFCRWRFHTITRYVSVLCNWQPCVWILFVCERLESSSVLWWCIMQGGISVTAPPVSLCGFCMSQKNKEQVSKTLTIIGNHEEGTVNIVKEEFKKNIFLTWSLFTPAYSTPLFTSPLNCEPKTATSGGEKAPLLIY